MLTVAQRPLMLTAGRMVPIGVVSFSKVCKNYYLACMSEHERLVAQVFYNETLIKHCFYFEWDT